MGKLSKVLEFLQQAQNNGHDFNEAKRQIQTSNPKTYNELSLSSKTSFEDMVFAVSRKKTELETSKKETIKKTKAKLGALVSQNKAEAQEKDRQKKQTLEFLHDIGFDRISQSKTNTLINYINIKAGTLGLDHRIDLENGSLGFNKDF